MNHAFSSIALVSGVLIAVPAFADEAPPSQPVRHVQRAAPVREAPVRQAAAPAQPNWTGSQVGGQGGVANMAQGFAEPGAHLFPFFCAVISSALCVETPFSFSGNRTGATGGGFLGYRWQWGAAVIGVETDINGKSLSASAAQPGTNAFRTEYFTGSVKESWDGSVRGRFGFLVTPWTLVYGTGGLAYGGVSGSFSYSARDIITGTSSVNGAGSWSTTRTGVTGGGGIETLIFPAWTVRLEYRYTDLGRFSENVALHTVCALICSSPSSNALINLHPTFQTVTVGVGYNF
jgi:outer membrane immunogenic protein